MTAIFVKRRFHECHVFLKICEKTLKLKETRIKLSIYISGVFRELSLLKCNLVVQVKLKRDPFMLVQFMIKNFI